MKTCCMCGQKFSGWGNNPQPFFSDGEGKYECCQECDDRFVIPVRMILGRNYENVPILMLIQTIAELGTSIHNANRVINATLPRLVRNEATNGEGDASEPPKAS